MTHGGKMEKLASLFTRRLFSVLIICIIGAAIGAKTAQAAVSISSFTARPDTIDLGGSSNLAWVTSSATSCDINGTAVAVNGNMNVSPVVNTTYTLTCQGTGGPAIATAWIKVRFVVQGKIKTPTGGNALANDVVVKYIRVFVMDKQTVGADRVEGTGYTNATGDFSISFTDTTEAPDIFIDVEYVGSAVDGKFIEVRAVNTDVSPIKDVNVEGAVHNDALPGTLNLGVLRVKSTHANIVSQVGAALRFLDGQYPTWTMPGNMNIEGRTTNGASFVSGDGSYMSISFEDYDHPGAVNAAFSDMHHESFHWVAYRAYGNRWPSPSCNISPHSSNAESCEGFAMAEGSAQYFGSSSAVPDQKTPPPAATDWRGQDGTGSDNSGEIVEGALELAWHNITDIPGALQVLLTDSPDSMKEFKDAYAIDKGITSAAMITFLNKCADNGIVYTRGKIAGWICAPGICKVKNINGVVFMRGQVDTTFSLLTKADLHLGANSATVTANQVDLGYKPAVLGLGGGTPTGFAFVGPVAFGTNLTWDTTAIADGDYDVLIRTRSIHNWVDTFAPDFTGDSNTATDTNEKWLKTLQTWYNQDTTPTTDDEGKIVVDNSIPTTVLQIKKTP